MPKLVVYNLVYPVMTRALLLEIDIVALRCTEWRERDGWFGMEVAPPWCDVGSQMPAWVSTPLWWRQIRTTFPFVWMYWVLGSIQDLWISRWFTLSFLCHLTRSLRSWSSVCQVLRLSGRHGESWWATLKVADSRWINRAPSTDRAKQSSWVATE